MSDNYTYQGDAELDESTNRVMMVGAALLFVLALVFPLYRWFEPANRDDARAANLASLAQQGEETFGFNCASCHGLNGEGGVGPALNSKQFLASATDLQIRQLISVGVPGSQMGAYAQDFGGPLTSEQIKSIAVFMRSWEEKAPDNPDWRAMIDG
ncbi:MAG: cytochrome c [Acidimicrobiales bacterium]